MVVSLLFRFCRPQKQPLKRFRVPPRPFLCLSSLPFALPLLSNLSVLLTASSTWPKPDGLSPVYPVQQTTASAPRIAAASSLGPSKGRAGV